MVCCLVYSLSSISDRTIATAMLLHLWWCRTACQFHDLVQSSSSAHRIVFILPKLFPFISTYVTRQCAHPTLKICYCQCVAVVAQPSPRSVRFLIRACSVAAGRLHQSSVTFILTSTYPPIFIAVISLLKIKVWCVFACVESVVRSWKFQQQPFCGKFTMLRQQHYPLCVIRYR